MHFVTSIINCSLVTENYLGLDIPKLPKKSSNSSSSSPPSPSSSKPPPPAPIAPSRKTPMAAAPGGAPSNTNPPPASDRGRDAGGPHLPLKGRGSAPCSSSLHFDVGRSMFDVPHSANPRAYTSSSVKTITIGRQHTSQS